MHVLYIAVQRPSDNVETLERRAGQEFSWAGCESGQVQLPLSRPSKEDKRLRVNFGKQESEP